MEIYFLSGALHNFFLGFIVMPTGMMAAVLSVVERFWTLGRADWQR